jgi:hypothetical protein
MKLFTQCKKWHWCQVYSATCHMIRSYPYKYTLSPAGKVSPQYEGRQKLRKTPNAQVIITHMLMSGAGQNQTYIRHKVYLNNCTHRTYSCSLSMCTVMYSVLVQFWQTLLLRHFYLSKRGTRARGNLSPRGSEGRLPLACLTWCQSQSPGFRCFGLLASLATLPDAKVDSFHSERGRGAELRLLLPNQQSCLSRGLRARTKVGGITTKGLSTWCKQPMYCKSK